MFYHLKISCYIRNLHAIDNNIMPIGTLLTIKVHHIVAYKFNIFILKFNLALYFISALVTKLFNSGNKEVEFLAIKQNLALFLTFNYKYAHA